MSKNKSLDTLAQAAEVVKNLSIIFGIFVAIVTLLSNLYDRRVATTLDFYKTYSDKIRTNYLDVTHKFNEYSDKIPNFLDLPHDEIKQKVIIFFSDNEDARNCMENLVDFFDSLHICVTNRSCDRNTMIDVLGEQVDMLYQDFAYYIFDKREKDNDPGFGKGLQELYKIPRESFLRTVSPG
jgi:hypothetical protein